MRGPTAGFTARAAASMSHSLTEISTRSTRPTLSRIVGHLHRGQVYVALRGVLDGEAALAQRGEVRAARDESDVAAGAREPAAVEAADAAGAHDENLHEAHSSPSYEL